MKNFLKNNELPDSTTNNIIILLVLMWLIFYGTFAIILLFNGLMHSYSFLEFMVEANESLPTKIQKLLFVMNGALIGSCTIGMVSFHNYVCMKNSFIQRHIWGYVIAPWLACFVSIIVYALLEIGLFTFSADISNSLEMKTIFALLVIGFLSGFGWYEAIKKITSITLKLFNHDETNNQSLDESDSK